MATTAFECIAALRRAGRTLATAESCTGGGIGAALTSVPGSSQVYAGGIISYTDAVKHRLLGVPEDILTQFGAVSAPVAAAMAAGARSALGTDLALSVTGLAGPGGDDYGNPVGTVYLGYCDRDGVYTRKYLFSGSRQEIRQAAIQAALTWIAEENP